MHPFLPSSCCLRINSKRARVSKERKEEGEEAGGKVKELIKKIKGGRRRRRGATIFFFLRLHFRIISAPESREFFCSQKPR